MDNEQDQIAADSNRRSLVGGGGVIHSCRTPRLEFETPADDKNQGRQWRFLSYKVGCLEMVLQRTILGPDEFDGGTFEQNLEEVKGLPRRNLDGIDACSEDVRPSWEKL